MQSNVGEHLQQLPYLIIKFNEENTNIVHSIFCKPMETLEEEKQSEGGHKFWTEIVSKYCEGQTCFCHSIPGTFDQVLNFKQQKSLNSSQICIKKGFTK